MTAWNSVTPRVGVRVWDRAPGRGPRHGPGYSARTRLTSPGAESGDGGDAATIVQSDAVAVEEPWDVTAKAKEIHDVGELVRMREAQRVPEFM